MNVFFANPLWLLGLLALIPLAAHLFSRTRPRKRLFPSLVLLREAARRVTRLRRPRDRWLLLLRTLAMAALVLAFLQPWLLGDFATRGAGAKTVVLVVDATASMGYVDGTRTRMAQVAALAEEVLNTLPSNSRANVVWIRGRAESVLPQPSPNLDFLKQALRQAVVRPEPGDVEGALTQAAKQLAAATGERELVVISDFQRTAWQNVNATPPAGIQFTRVAVGTETEANVGLGELTVEPPEPTVGQAARMICRVRNLSSEPRRITVFGEAGGNRLSQSLELAAWSEGLAVMPVTFGEAGSVLLKASASEDRFPGDDARYALVTARGALPVAIVGAPDNATEKVWKRAAEAMDGVAARMIDAGQLPSLGNALILVPGWTGANADLLRARINAGSVVMIQPGPGLSADIVKSLWIDEKATAQPQPWSFQEKVAPGWALRIAAEDHPIFALFADGAYGDPTAGRFRRRVLPPGIEPEFPRPLLTFDDGMPALAIREVTARDAQNRVVPLVWWNLDLGQSDWSSRSSFVSFFGELLRYLGAFTRSTVSRESRSGDLLRFQPDPAVDPRDVTLVDEKDSAQKLQTESSPAGAHLATQDGAGPGAYRWIAQGGVLERSVVNFPESESDLRRMDAGALQALGGNVIGASAFAGIRALREGTPLWPWLVALAALCLLLEGLLLRSTRVPASAPETGGKAPAKPEEAVRV